MVISPKIIRLEADSFKDGKMKSLNIVAGGDALFHFWLLDLTPPPLFKPTYQLLSEILN